MNNVNDNRCRISDRDLMNLIDPQGTILANLAAIKSKGYKISKDRVSKFLKETRKNNGTRKNINTRKNNTRKYNDTINNNNTMKYSDTMYNNDLEDVFEALKSDYLHNVCTSQNYSTNKTLTRKQFNNTINKMLKELKNTPLKAFDEKKEEIVNWAKYNFYKVTDKDRPFETFMNGLRLYISKLKEQAPRRTLEERKGEAAKRLAILLDKLKNAQNFYEFGTTENQIYTIVDSFNNAEKSNDARVKLNELRLEWEKNQNNPF